MDNFSQLPRPRKTLPELKTGKDAPKVHLASRGHLNCFDADLVGERGAEHVIEKIRTARTVTRLILGFNKLGDAGCVSLFTFLSSEEGTQYDRILELNISGNGIGEVGLLAISYWLQDNAHIRELYLQNNAFELSPMTIDIFASSLSSSYLRSLSLNTNRHLSDSFVAAFLPSLTSPHLRELQMSDIALTSISRRVVSEFIRRRGPCRLQTLKLSANSLGAHGVGKAVRALEHNFWLTHLELVANRTADRESPDSSGAEDTAAYVALSRLDHERLLRFWTIRNETLQRTTQADALRLLRHARPALLRSWWQEHHDSSATATKLPDSVGIVCPESSRRLVLPTELVMHVLSFIAPNLSIVQQSRVHKYAADRRTLPSLALSLPTLTHARRNVTADVEPCVPDPMSSGFGLLSGGPGSGFGLLGGPTVPTPPRKVTAAKPAGPLWAVAATSGAPGTSTSGCVNGYMGAGNHLRCAREETRKRWLELVGCDLYDPPQT